MGQHPNTSNTILYFFINDSAPVKVTGTINAASFYFLATLNYWKFAISDDPFIQPEEMLSDELGFYLDDDYGDAPFAASWMDADTVETIIEWCANEYLSRKGLS